MKRNSSSDRHRPARRDFLRASAVAGLAAGLGSTGCDAPDGSDAAGTADSSADSASAPTVRARRVLGRTGIEVPDISFGTFSLSGDVELVRYALDRGVTHFDTAEAYMKGQAEETLGRALEGRRDQVTLTTKLVAGPEMRADAMMGRLEESLGRLRTDYVDLFLNHAVDDVARVENPEWGAFVERAKAEGKIRFSGMSGHGPSLLPCLERAVEEDWLDAILVAYNYVQTPSFFDTAYLSLQRLLGRVDWVSQQPELPAFLERAQAKGVGVMVMKTLRGARHNDMRPYERGGATFAQAALRWVLADSRVDGAVISMNDRALVDEYLGASGFTGPEAGDLALLHRYEALNRSQQCVQGCDGCVGACPSEVPISEVLRFGMYDRDYGLPEIAQSGYRALSVTAAACERCPSQSCLAACPTGVDVPRWTADTHRRLAVG